MCTVPVAAERMNENNAADADYRSGKKTPGEPVHTPVHTPYNTPEYRVYMHAGSVSLVTFLNRLGCERNLNVDARARKTRIRCARVTRTDKHRYAIEHAFDA